MRIPVLRRDDLVAACRIKGIQHTGHGMTVEKLLAALQRVGVERADIPALLKSGGVQAAPAATANVSEEEVQAALKAVMPQVLTPAALKQFVADVQAASNVTRTVNITQNGVAVAKLKKHTHPMFDKVLKLVAAGLNVLLVGPAGCGKTTLAEMVAEALKRTYGALHCTAGASESQLTGWLLPIGKDGAFSYVASEFVTLYEKGDSVFLLDEIDAADPNMLLVINSALANASMHVPSRYNKPHIPRGKNASIIAAANTYGTGADMMYSGRNQLDAATLDRFYVVTMDYDSELEAMIIGDKQADKDMGAWCLGVRAVVKQHKMRRVVSTRTIQKAIAARRAGIDVNDIKRELLAGWTADELARIAHLR